MEMVREGDMRQMYFTVSVDVKTFKREHAGDSGKKQDNTSPFWLSEKTGLCKDNSASGPSSISVVHNIHWDFCGGFVSPNMLHLCSQRSKLALQNLSLFMSAENSF